MQKKFTKMYPLTYLKNKNYCKNDVIKSNMVFTFRCKDVLDLFRKIVYTK